MINRRHDLNRAFKNNAKRSEESEIKWKIKGLKFQINYTSKKS